MKRRQRGISFQSFFALRDSSGSLNSGNRQAGVTFIELLIVVAIISMLLTLSAPAMQKFVAQRRVKNVELNLIGQLQRTQLQVMSSKAISGEVSSLSGSDDWSTGWRVQESYPTNTATKGIESVDFDFGIKSPVLTITALNAAATLSFGRQGQLIGAVGERFQLCYAGYPNLTRIVEITRAGQVRGRTPNASDPAC